ncbi:carboxypeptidase-like regulatory domain-containing protein [Thermoflexibacter ruber]|uniref:Carboxypeptidase regulatory-like domain-containing protein n=1 Tax=Thermoflexibacter ruber TaxID=1003 RepID=A0A1I2JQS4_9BACT|nr:carboxypeptidase-like regulatory domain-containing protein [Thermoflexibacter ruber]SFF56468.1 hypothetical protein SAMN04488541_10599 [Thermoflexibacter ruber]
MLCWTCVFFVLTSSFSSDLFAQAGNITIYGGSSNVIGGSTWNYSVIGASCTQTNWFVSGGTVLSSSNTTVTIQWNVLSSNGTIQVSCSGCSPEPVSRYGSLNVTITAPTITISGRITNSSGQGISGVSIGGTTTNSTGNYSITVSVGYSGILTPILNAHAFSPASRSYYSVTTNQVNQDYIRLTPYFCQFEAPRSPNTPVSPISTCEAIWQICNLPSNSYVWRFTNWDNTTFDEPTTTNQSPMFRVPCGGRNTFKSVCVRAVNTTEWYCINY